MNVQPNFGDVPAWCALTLSLYAIWQNRRSTRFGKQSADAADRSVDEATRANQIAERALDFEQSRNVSGEAGTPAVAWEIERGSGSEYILRNFGHGLAEHVEVDATRAPAINRNLPNGSIIGPGEGHRMLLKGSMQSAMPPQLYLRWTGQDEWVAVRLPG